MGQLKFARLVIFLFSDGRLHAIYDITLAYSDPVPLEERSILRGDLPKEIHFLVRRSVNLQYIDPRGRPQSRQIVITIFTQVVRPYVRPSVLSSNHCDCGLA